MSLIYAKASAQKVLDEVVAEVGNEIVLLSDVEAQLLQYKDAPPAKQALAKCLALDQLMQKKLLLTRAKIDSLKINDEQVEGELNRRMAFFTQQYGSEDAIEKFYHKSILQIKSDFRDAVKDQLLEEQMQSKVVGEVEPTPEEIQRFYDAIPKDSLPRFNTELEIGQIFVVPKATRDDRAKVTERLRQMRKDIMEGKKSFCSQAIAYSRDIGSALKCGDLGWKRADEYVPEFSAAAVLLKKDSISDVVETKFGFHIIKMIERRGDMMHLAHILLFADMGQGAIDRTKGMLDSLKREVMKGAKDSLFTAFAYQYSEDQDTKNRGGMMIDSKSSSSHIPVDELEAVTFEGIDKLRVGDISEPIPYRNSDNKDGYRLLYLKSKNAPHQANLKDDYPKIKQMAQEDKKGKALDIWFKKYIPNTYIHITSNYNGCKALDKWHRGAASSLGN